MYRMQMKKDNMDILLYNIQQVQFPILIKLLGDSES